MISLPKEPKIIEKDDNYAKIEIESLYPGYGVTIGNSLRRVLLSSLHGAACTQAKIENVQHEFSTIPGVLEDVVALSLNLKQLNFKLHGDEAQTVTLSAKGEQEITAGDLEAPSQVEIINDEALIATLTESDAELKMELKVEKGLGYSSSEENKEEKLESGVIALDAIFSPIEKVSYDIEDMRVGGRTDYNRLDLEIKTDGSIAPEEAFIKASDILCSHFSSLKEGLQQRKEKKEEARNKKVEDLDFSTRTKNVLLDNNIKSIAGIMSRREETLSNLSGMGQKSLEEIKEVLDKYDLELK